MKVRMAAPTSDGRTSGTITRHNVARRIDCRFLAQLVTEHKIEQDEAFELAPELAYGLAKRAYKL